MSKTFNLLGVTHRPPRPQDRGTLVVSILSSLDPKKYTQLFEENVSKLDVRTKEAQKLLYSFLGLIVVERLHRINRDGGLRLQTMIEAAQQYVQQAPKILEEQGLYILQGLPQQHQVI